MIGEDETRAAFDRVVPAVRGSDCSVLGVETRFERIMIRLGAGQSDLPPVLVTRRGCGGTPIGSTNQAIEIPATTSARCPLAVARMQAALGGDGH